MGNADLMADMYSQRATNWCWGKPGSATNAATFHALVYHQTNVRACRLNIAQSEFNVEFEPLLIR